MDTDMVTSGRMLGLYSLVRQMLFEAQRVRTNEVLPNIGVRAGILLWVGRL